MLSAQGLHGAYGFCHLDAARSVRLATAGRQSLSLMELGAGLTLVQFQLSGTPSAEELLKGDSCYFVEGFAKPFHYALPSS